MKNEEIDQVAVRLPETIARQFKSKCAINGTTQQAQLEKWVTEWVNK